MEDCLPVGVWKREQSLIRDPRFGKGKRFDRQGIRWASVGGIAYVATLAGMMSWLSHSGRFALLFAGVGVAYFAVLGVMTKLPASAFFQCPVKHAYSSRVEAMLRLTWFTMMLTSFPLLRLATGINFAPIFGFSGSCRC